MRRVTMIAVAMGLIAISAAFAEDIRIGGGGAAITGTIRPAQETFEEETGIKLIIMPSKAGRALVDLDQGAVDAIVTAHSIEHLLQGATKEKVIINPASLYPAEVGKNQTVIFLHKSNRIKTLPKKELKAIFTGKVTNWKQLGGENKKITVIWSSATPGQNAIFEAQMLDGEHVTSKAVSVTGYEEVRAKVIAIPGAIGVCPHGLIASAVNVPETPEIVTPVLLITKGEAPAKVKKLIEFLKEMSFIP